MASRFLEMPEQSQEQVVNPTGIIREYLKDNDDTFRQLEEVRARVTIT